MKMNLFYICSALVSASMAIASESESHAELGPSSLLFPFFNFAIFVGFLTWKLKAPLKLFFEDRSKKITEIFNRARVKSQEAKVRQSHLEEKLRSLDKEIAKINKDNADLMKHWEARIVAETKAKLEKLSSESRLRLDAEKQGLFAGFKRQMLNEVTNKTKLAVASNKSSGADASKKILEGLGT